jgi:branched-subunit amino acid transport protein
MRIWLSLAAVTVATWLMKAAGPLALGDRPLPAALRTVVGLMAPTLLAALVVVEVGGPGWSELDGLQLAGVAAAGVLRWRGAPLPAAVVAGALVTALLRLV